MQAGKTLDFNAEVKMGDAKHGNQKVTWTVQGRQSNSTSVNADGLLTVAADEYIGGELTVQALSTVDNKTVGTYKVKVTSPWDTEGIGDIEPGTLKTATLDGIDWYVLARDGNKALLLSKDILEKRSFDGIYLNGDNIWRDSEMRTYLNGTWLSGKTTINAHVAQTTLNTRQEWNSDEFFETQDKVFLLSEADVFGTVNTNLSSEKVAVAKDYTLGKVGVIVPENMRKALINGSGYHWWLRSPRYNINNLTVVNIEGAMFDNGVYYASDGGIRPALWINLGS